MSRVQKALAGVNLVLAFIATTAPLAHVLELISKFSLNGTLWLQVQQQLYRGWGALFGPIEIAALATSLWLFFIVRPERRAYLVATICYVLMLTCFFVLNDPVNKAFSSWTISTLPGDWPQYRWKWEAGHALAALFSVVAFVTLVGARIRSEAARQV